jgi:hypothetical protein
MRENVDPIQEQAMGPSSEDCVSQMRGTCGSCISAPAFGGSCSVSYVAYDLLPVVSEMMQSIFVYVPRNPTLINRTNFLVMNVSVSAYYPAVAVGI